MAGLDDRHYTARDLLQLAGLSYRQLNDWESKGVLPATADRRERWRRFTPRDLFAAMICAEIRRRFGVPLDKVKFVLDFMHREDTNRLSAAIRLMDRGLSVYLLTDLAETFVMDSDLEFGMRMHLGFFRADVPQNFLFISVNPIVNRLLTAVKEPYEIIPSAANPTDSDDQLVVRERGSSPTTMARSTPRQIRIGRRDQS